jgi:hypothetical protein
MEFDDASSPDPPVVLYGYDDDRGAFDDVTAEEQDASQDGRQIPSR